MLEPAHCGDSSIPVSVTVVEDADVEFWKNRPGVTLSGRMGRSGVVGSVAGSVAMSANHAALKDTR